MNTRERIVIYGALALLGALNLSTVLGLGSPEAMAEPSAIADELGPATSLTLTGEAEPLVLRNNTGHLAWADNAHAQAYSVAFVAPGKAMGPLLEADQYTEEVQELQDELRAQGQETGLVVLLDSGCPTRAVSSKTGGRLGRSFAGTERTSRHLQKRYIRGDSFRNGD